MKTFLILLCFSTSLFAQDFVFDKTKGRAVPSFIGQLKLFVGKVKVVRNGVETEVKHGERFNATDAIKTSPKSIAKILMIDDTMITVGPNSEMAFSEFEFTDKNNRKTLYSLVRGQMVGEVKTKAKPNEVRFRTKFAAMGVRGTHLLLNFQTIGTKDISQFALAEGKAVVEEDGGKGKHEMVKADHVIIVNDQASDSSISDKQTLTNEEVEKLSNAGMNDEKDFRPVLPLFDLAQITSTSPFYSSTDKVIEVQKNDTNEATRMQLKKKNKSWKQNLDKLNEQLKDNQKKDS